MVEGAEYFPYNEHNESVTTSKARPNSIFIFIDAACEKQDNIKAFFAMGRHKDVECFYLCQTYARIPKHLICDHFNLLELFKQDEMNFKHIYVDHVNTNILCYI